MLIVNDVEYPIIMLGYIYDGQLLFELPGYSKEQAKEIFQDVSSMTFINADGEKNDMSKMKFIGFLDDERTMVILK